jgi:hypothetical protein
MAYTTIDDPEAHFQTVIYTGNGSANHAITLPGDTDMQPDWVWIKNRDAADSHCFFDAVRGATKLLHMDNTDAETTDTDTLDSFTSDGFQVDADVKVNTNAEKYVAWCWKANGTGSSNTDGSINTTATSANTTAGFSINTYTGTGSNATIGHGLGQVPTVIITSKRSATKIPVMYHVDCGNANELYMDRTDACSSASTTWNSTTPTSTVWSVGTNTNNTSGATQVTYLFAPIQGFSKFGKYTGNGNADGTFVYTGFRPAWVMVKGTSGSKNWFVWYNKVEGFNPENRGLNPNTTAQDNATDFINILSNGFKFLSTDSEVNGGDFIYMAFAEAPLVNSKGVPNNAR